MRKFASVIVMPKNGIQEREPDVRQGPKADAYCWDGQVSLGLWILSAYRGNTGSDYTSRDCLLGH